MTTPTTPKPRRPRAKLPTIDPTGTTSAIDALAATPEPGLAPTAIDARQVPPGELIIDANVRADTKIDRAFVSSLKQHGVLVPLLVEETPERSLKVKDGQRRALAAVEAGLDLVPVVVVPPGTDADRVIDQLVVNDHRAELSDAEHATAFKQLSLFGISADAISRKTNIPKKRVELALTVASSDVALAAATTYQLNLEQAAIVLEFDDNPDDVETLTDAVKAGRFDHTAAQIRYRRAEEAALAAARKEHADAGVQVVEIETPAYDARKGPGKLEYLYWTGKDRGNYTSIKDGKHKTCPGHAVIIRPDFDWGRDDAGRQIRIPAAKVVPVCLDPDAHGHIRYSTTPGKTEDGGGLSDAERAKRKLTRENNKAWAIASPVRVKFITELLQRKEPPAGWAEWVAHVVATWLDNYTLDKTAAHELLDDPGNRELDAWFKNHPTQPAQLLLAITFAGLEGQRDFAKDGWRFYRQDYLVAYLTQLSTWGYTFSDIEERVVAGTADKAQP